MNQQEQPQQNPVVEKNTEKLGQEANTKPVADKGMKEIVRIVHTDLEGTAGIYYGLTKVKGISWALSGVVCHLLNLDRKKQVGTFTEAEIKKIELTIKNLHEQNLPNYLLNRPKTEEGTPRHVIATDLELQTKLDVRKLREMQCYRGIRHAIGLPVRGQRTKAHFRKGKSLGVVRKKPQPSKKKPAAGKKKK